MSFCLNLLYSWLNYSIQAYNSGISIIFMWEMTLSHRPLLAFTCIIDEECVKTSQSLLSLICIGVISQHAGACKETSARTFASSLREYYIFRKKKFPKIPTKEGKPPLPPQTQRLLWWPLGGNKMQVE